MTSALATDLYELTMMAGYDCARLGARATFELYVRQLPRNRTFLVAAGLEQAIEYLEGLRFTESEIAWLRTVPGLAGVPNRFFDETLASLRFTGDVDAVPEGTPVFAYEPLLRVSAPFVEAQLVETALLAHMTFQTSIASKAARIVRAARGRSVMEFGGRRAHGPEAALLAARAAYVAGCASTSNVEAGFRFGIPLSGTMAHSWVTSFADEIESFRCYASVHGDRSIFLVDTYDTLESVRKIVRSGLKPAGVRLDSGDLVSLSREVRRILDAGGLNETRIFASGDLDEWSMAALAGQDVPVDGFGVGTALSTSKDAPALGGIYKLVEIDRSGVDTPVMKLSGGKASYPGAKQVYRHVEDGRAVRDTIALVSGDEPPKGRPLLEPVLRKGARVRPAPHIDAIRRHHAVTLAELPESILQLDTDRDYSVELSPALHELTSRTAETITGRIG